MIRVRNWVLHNEKHCIEHWINEKKPFWLLLTCPTMVCSIVTLGFQGCTKGKDPFWNSCDGKRQLSLETVLCPPRTVYTRAQADTHVHQSQHSFQVHWPQLSKRANHRPHPAPLVTVCWATWEVFPSWTATSSGWSRLSKAKTHKGILLGWTLPKLGVWSGGYWSGAPWAQASGFLTAYI